uniref:alkaline phosphatase n=1 Tax=Stomoxys calcitrans TaxID=35570 RepID=A0A1I8PCT0_STOCA
MKLHAVHRVLLWAILVACLQQGLCSKSQDMDGAKERRMHPKLKHMEPSKRTSQRPGEDTQEFWQNESKDFIRQQQRHQRNIKVAKNIILFLGDGMGLATQVAARSYIQAEHTKLSFEDFPYTGLSKTYCVDDIVPDSATTATAYLCGVKANTETIGVNAQIGVRDCEAMKNTDNHVFSIAKWAMDAGKSAGLVTTTRVTHASPAGVYAHTAFREWETNADIEGWCGKDHGLDDIALQLIHGEVGSRLKLMMGGGKSTFMDSKIYSEGWRSDGRNLIDEYIKKSVGNAYVETLEELEKLDLTKAERLMGIFHDSNMDYYLDTLALEKNTQPTLEQMTRKAIEFMQQQKDDKGYFLFIEGGEIDLAHHDTKARLALEETKQFSQAIALARAMTSEEDTLIVVTADHSHTFSVAGYQDRGSDIFSLVDSDIDDMPYSPLSYANGNSTYLYYNEEKRQRVDPSLILKNEANDLFPATVPIEYETHGGEDVGVFASGPWAHLFTGVYEQNAIPHMMAYAACIGDGLKACDTLSGANV